MAKKKRGRPRGSANKPRLQAAAETIGGTLGSVMAKVDAWMAQREEIAKELRAAADRVMAGESPFPLRRRIADAAGKPTMKKKRPTLSTEARERIAAAQRARWAAVKAGKARKSGKKKGDIATT